MPDTETGIPNPVDDAARNNAAPQKKGKKINRSARLLKESSEQITTPAFIQEKAYGLVMAKTIEEVDKVKNRPQPSRSFTEKHLESESRDNEAAYLDGKGALYNGPA